MNSITKLLLKTFVRYMNIYTRMSLHKRTSILLILERLLFFRTVKTRRTKRNSHNVQSTARQTIQNCQTSPVDILPYSLHHNAQIRLGIFDS
jgi:hypothetical protein